MQNGNCDLCGRWSSTLMGAICSLCRDKFRASSFDTALPEVKGLFVPMPPGAPTDVQALANVLILSIASRQPDVIIGAQDNPYLLRWWLRRDRGEGSIYLHQIRRNDDDRALHDHPWQSTSIILRGTLREVLPDGVSRLLEPGSITSRTAEQAHRLEVVDCPVWSLFVTGPVVRDWGFHCPNGWVPWQEFTKPENPGEIGKGCGE